jgi:sec-independent protein translocase protein TatB
MFGVDTTEFIIVAVAALLFIGPKDLPQAMRAVGRWVGKIRGMARHFSSGIDAVIREAELEEMEKKWREENDRIMRDYPAVADAAALEADPAAEARAYLQGQAPPVADAAGADPGADLPPAQRPLP